MSFKQYAPNCAIIFCLIISVCFLPAFSHAAPRKVLVVMSYDEAYTWSQELKQGIDKVLPSSDWTLQYTYLDTKKHFEQGANKAKDIYALYQEFQPDAVIAADDNAQSLFVVPYLKDKVTTPVIFCGVNSEPEAYGYPATNVTGVLERPFIAESTAFLKTVIPDIDNVAYMIKDSPTGELYFQHVQRTFDEAPIFKMPKTIEEALAMVEELKPHNDALFIMTLNGLSDETGRLLNDEEIVPRLVEAFGKPTCTDLEAYLKYGVLCAVAQSGQIQGELAAKMVKAILEQGVSPSEIAISRNYWGKRILNVTTLKQLGIKPQFKNLVGVELIKSAE